MEPPKHYNCRCQNSPDDKQEIEYGPFARLVLAGYSIEEANNLLSTAKEAGADPEFIVQAAIEHKKSLGKVVYVFADGETFECNAADAERAMAMLRDCQDADGSVFDFSADTNCYLQIKSGTEKIERDVGHLKRILKYMKNMAELQETARKVVQSGFSEAAGIFRRWSDFTHRANSMLKAGRFAQAYGMTWERAKAMYGDMCRDESQEVQASQTDFMTEAFGTFAEDGYGDTFKPKRRQLPTDVAAKIRSDVQRRKLERMGEKPPGFEEEGRHQPRRDKTKKRSYLRDQEILDRRRANKKR